MDVLDNDANYCGSRRKRNEDLRSWLNRLKEIRTEKLEKSIWEGKITIPLKRGNIRVNINPFGHAGCSNKRHFEASKLHFESLYRPMRGFVGELCFINWEYFLTRKLLRGWKVKNLKKMIKANFKRSSLLWSDWQKVRVNFTYSSTFLLSNVIAYVCASSVC